MEKRPERNTLTSIRDIYDIYHIFNKKPALGEVETAVCKKNTRTIAYCYRCISLYWLIMADSILDNFSISTSNKQRQHASLQPTKGQQRSLGPAVHAAFEGRRSARGHWVLGVWPMSIEELVPIQHPKLTWNHEYIYIYIYRYSIYIYILIYL